MRDGLPEIVMPNPAQSSEAFRPVDGADYLSGMRCVAVDCVLANGDAAAMVFLLQFARNNQYELQPGRKARRPGAWVAKAVAGRIETAEHRDRHRAGRRSCGYAIALTAADRRLL